MEGKNELVMVTYDHNSGVQAVLCFPTLRCHVYRDIFSANMSGVTRSENRVPSIFTFWWNMFKSERYSRNVACK